MNSPESTDQTGPAHPLISVIVPIYNVEDHITACIDSLRRQTFADFEVILVDDGATDHSQERARQAMQGDPRFHLIVQDNQGLSGARNTGLDAARGAFIAFVDSDDRVMPDFLHRLHSALEDTGADWVACGVRFCLPDGSGQPHSTIHGASDLSLHQVIRRYRFDSWSDVIRHFPSAWNKLYRRSLIDGLRFDEGTWFEDHGFFQRVAARTDHLLHVPDALYLQTQDREGQITGRDDDRVFEQFDVLRHMRRDLDASHPGADTAFARIATRLIYERSTVLRDPARRARFAKASVEFLTGEGLKYEPNLAQDPEITQSWALEMAGILPLSVVIPWHGHTPDLLNASLAAVANSRGPGHEILIVCDTASALRTATALAAPYPQARVVQQSGRGAGAARNYGLVQAQGQFITFLDAGDCPHPWAYLRWCEALLATDTPMAIAQYRIGAAPKGAVHTGFHDPEVLPTGLPKAGAIDITSMLALTLEAQISAKLFRRSFLVDSGLRFAKGDHPDWALCITAARHAGRVAYCPWAGVEIADTPEAQTIRQGRYSATRLWKGHRAVVQAIQNTLPKETTTRLPKGWQRRLYARALREQLHFGCGGRLAQATLLAGAAMGAAVLGFGRSGVKPAGLDPFVGPKQALILDARMLLGAILAKLRGLPIILPDPTQNARHATAHQAFVLGNRGVFRFYTDFHGDDYANLSFHAPEIAHIPLHLSLRFREQCAVCNDTRNDGTWRAERSLPLNLPRGGTEITLTLTPKRVRVQADGVEIFNLRTWRIWRRSGVRALDQITTFTTQGGLRIAEMLPQTADKGQLLLDTRLQLRAQTTPGMAPEDHTLTASATPTAPGISLPVLPCANANGALAFLPGRAWANIGPDEDLHLTLSTPKAKIVARLTLSRQTLAHRIATLLNLHIGHEDAALVLLIIEHLHHGGLIPLLPAHAQARALALAGRFGQTDALTTPAPDNPAPQATPAIDAHTSQFHSALAQFSRSQMQDPAPDPLEVLAGLTLAPEPRRGLFLTLSEYFCQEGRDTEGFVALARQLAVPLPNPETELPDPHRDPWTASAMLPFLICQGEGDIASTLLVELAEPNDGWVLTPPVAWCAHQALRPGRLSDAARRRILYGFMLFLSNRADDYWERTPCQALTQAAVAMICHQAVLPHPKRQQAIGVCLTVYGLSRQFWHRLGATYPKDIPLPEPLETARAHFLTLAQNGPDTQRALDYFVAQGVAGASRFQRDLLGPGAAIDTKPLRLDEIPSPRTIDSPLVRQMAMPGYNAPAPVGVAPAVVDLYTTLPRAPHYMLQTQVGDALNSLWRHPERPTPNLHDQLATISQEESQFLGVALGINLLALRNAPQDADWLTQMIGDMPPAQRRKLAEAPAVRMALAALRDRGGDSQQALSHLITPKRALPAPGPADNGGLPAPAPFLDTLVVVFSCQAYLDTRVPALRNGWLGQLEALGVPYIVVVGDGDGQRDGDVVYLDAPDDYEGLPKKTLAAIAWVRDHTRFAHMVKIDDDCFLNAPLFFHGLTYRKFDYYGRRLARVPGQMDRAWHQAKSRSDRGRMEFDKSSEPSAYADGGSGYALSRDGMEAALEAAASPEGQQLIQQSFMEDKMLGDLLALRGIAVHEEDYRVTIRRRTHRDAIPVASWHNSFLPSTDAPVQLAHLDTHLTQAETLAQQTAPGLRPRKIWPSYQNVKLGYQSNALELISSEASVQAARDADIAVVACMRNEMFMLPHFLAHYRALGVGSFLIADNCSDDGTLEYLADQPDVALFSVDTDYNQSRYGVAWQQAMMAAFRMNKWSLVADADELLIWQHPQTTTLPQLINSPAFATTEAARIFMLDMYPKGPLSDATFASGDPFAEAGFADTVPFLTDSPMRGPYSDQPAWTSALRHRLIPGSAPNLFTAQKLALLRYRPWMRLSAGLHFVGDAHLAAPELFFAHFKYNAAFRQKAKTEVARRQHFNDAEEYKKYLALASEGRDTIYDPELSTPWHQSPFVQKRLF